MPKLSRFQIMQHFKNQIFDYFNQDSKVVYTYTDLTSILFALKTRYNLASVTTVEDFIQFLTSKSILESIELKFPNRTVMRYSKPNTSIIQIASSLDKKAYLSHYSAMFLNNLTNNIPKNIYINIEQFNKSNYQNSEEKGKLDQANIDRAFSRPMRMTNQVAYAEHYNSNIYLLNGKNVGRIGVVDYTLEDNSIVPITNIERTLIDITVRPNYAGGVQEVLYAYELAKGKVSTNKLVATLKKMDYIYPYHQAIGFYMEKAGYKENALNLLEKIGINYNFYLTYQMKEKDYSSRWKLYFPKGL